MCRKLAGVLFCLFPALLAAQQKTDLQQVLDRLDRIEQENKDLADEVRALRAELLASRTASAATQSTTTTTARINPGPTEP